MITSFFLHKCRETLEQSSRSNQERINYKFGQKSNKIIQQNNANLKQIFKYKEPHL